MLSMTHRSLALTILVVFVSAIALATASGASVPTSPVASLPTSHDANLINQRDPAMDILAAHGWVGPLARRQGPVDAIIEMTAPPTLRTFIAARQSGMQTDSAGRAAQAQLAQLQSAQQALLAPL